MKSIVEEALARSAQEARIHPGVEGKRRPCDQALCGRRIRRKDGTPAVGILRGFYGKAYRQTR